MIGNYVSKYRPCLLNRETYSRRPIALRSPVTFRGLLDKAGIQVKGLIWASEIFQSDHDSWVTHPAPLIATRDQQALSVKGKIRHVLSFAGHLRRNESTRPSQSRLGSV